MFSFILWYNSKSIYPGGNSAGFKMIDPHPVDRIQVGRTVGCSGSADRFGDQVPAIYQRTYVPVIFTAICFPGASYFYLVGSASLAYIRNIIPELNGAGGGRRARIK